MAPTKKTLIVLVVGSALLASYVAAGPFIAIHRIKSAVVHHDSEALASNVAFPELRENLKEQFNAILLRKASTELQGNPFAGLGMLFVSKMVDTLVDSSVTPSGLAALMSGKSPEQSRDSRPSSSDSRLLPNARYTYDSISKFSAWVRAKDGRELRIVFTRYDLSWKLSNILLPADLFSGAQAAASSTAPSPDSISADAPTPATDSASSCLKIQTFDSSVLSRNDVFTEVAWKADLQNTCSRDFNAKVKFVLYDKDDFELDTDSQTLVVPASGIGKARGKMLVSPPAKAARMAKQGATFSAY
jgi:hypothetical protein